ncbi:hypothetical a-type peptide pheromone precursor, partial [Postia placenta Mad-698-R]
MDSFEFDGFDLEAFLLASSRHAEGFPLPANGMLVNFDHKSDGYPGYCVIT